MCIGINTNLSKIEVAEKNIPCYKYLKKGGRSESNRFVYKKYKLNVNSDGDGTIQRQIAHHDKIEEDYAKSCNREFVKPTYYELEQGFHSRIPGTTSMRTNLFMIPKGTSYITGGENSKPDHSSRLNNYLSERIVYLGKNTWLNRVIASLVYGVEFK